MREMSNLVYEKMLAYKFRRQEDLLSYEDSEYAKELIRAYFEDSNYNKCLLTDSDSFIDNYIRNETFVELEFEDDNLSQEMLSKINYYLRTNSDLIERLNLNKAIQEGIANFRLEEKARRQDFEANSKGLRDVYNYIHSGVAGTIKLLNVNLMLLHQQLYKHFDYPNFGGKYRTFNCFISETSVETTEYSLIDAAINKLNPMFVDLLDRASNMENIEDVFNYIEGCIKLKYKILLVHPFPDGNGRVTRALTNMLFERAGIPSVYIGPVDKEIYLDALKEANNGNFEPLKAFYYYKISDTIVEIDIDKKLEEEKYLIKGERKRLRIR